MATKKMICAGVFLLIFVSIYYNERAGLLLTAFRVCSVDTAARMDGRTVLITGANSGVGYESALELAKRGARVILGCRNTRKCAEAVKKVQALSKPWRTSVNPDTDIVPLEIDLSSFKSVRKAATRVLKHETRLDVLMNSAGSVFKEFQLTEDGIESTFQVNHVSHFLLTQLLLPLLLKSAPSRVVVVSSLAHIDGIINFDDLNLRSDYNIDKSYARSKLANVLFCSKFAAKLKGKGVTCNSLCPGFVATNIFQHHLYSVRVIFAILSPFLFKSSKEGAQTQILLSVDPALENVSGEFFMVCRRHLPDPSKSALNITVTKNLWIKTEELVSKFLN